MGGCSRANRLLDQNVSSSASSIDDEEDVTSLTNIHLEEDTTTREEGTASGDREYERLRHHIKQVSAEAQQVGSLARHLASSAASRPPHSAERQAVLRSRLRCLVKQRGALTPGVPGDDEQEREADAASSWWDDYQRFRREGEVAELLKPEHRLQRYAEEHRDRVAAVRHPPGQQRAAASKLSAAPSNGVSKLSQKYEEESCNQRQRLLRQIYEQQLEQIAADKRFEKTRTRRSAPQAHKENLVGFSGGQLQQPPRSRLQRKLAAIGGTAPLSTSGYIKSSSNQGRRQTQHPRRRPVPHVPHDVKDTGDVGNELLADLLERFPFLDLSRETVNELRGLADKRVAAAAGVGSASRGGMAQSKVQRQVAEAERRQRLLAGILRKELESNMRLRDKRERRAQEQALKAHERDRRLVLKLCCDTLCFWCELSVELCEMSEAAD